MTSITRELRKDLEKTVKQARRVAEAGARQAVQQLRVGDGDAPKDPTADQRALRTRLRAHGRQLGDRRDAKTGAQETAHLVQECAYEHWHRMLFARFLAETDLLIEPESGMSITIDEVQELAREKATDWLQLASEYAERMLPQIFRKDDPVLKIALPPETRSEIEDLLKGLSKPVFEADDSLGWVYQYWQTDKKEEVNRSEARIGADELPAVTQLFTEDYMVLFLLHNTLGAWWAGKVIASNPSIATSSTDEAALRIACKVGDIDWAFLRFVKVNGIDGTDGSWRPAAGTFETWPRTAKELTLLDPCMGSGHFLVFALPIFVALRMAEENLSQSAAVDAVLRDNLFGLEIDPRCTQIAAFNLAFAAWRKVGHRTLPQLNLACSGLAIGVSKPEWLKLAEKAVTAADPAAKRDLLGVEKNLLTVGLEERVKGGLEALYDLFAKAPWLGSLIDPRRAGADIFREGFEKLQPLLASILAAADTDDAREMAVAAQGMTKAAELLSRKFTMVTTNVPYLGRGKQHNIIQEYCQNTFPNAKSDLSTSFLERCLAFNSDGGITAAVTPQAWLFLASYKTFRQYILKHQTLNAVIDLGPAAFNEMNWWAARTALICVVAGNNSSNKPHVLLDGDTGRELSRKPNELRSREVRLRTQPEQLAHPDSIIAVRSVGGGSLLSEYVNVYEGLSTGDNDRYRMCFWEVLAESKMWSPFISTNLTETEYGGRHNVIRWEQGHGELSREESARIQGMSAWPQRGVLLSVTGTLRAQLKCAQPHEKTTVAVVARNVEHLGAVFVYMRSAQYQQAVRALNQKTAVSTGVVAKVPFDLEYWQREFSAQYPTGLPDADSIDPTQWLFGGQPRHSTAPLATAAIRLVNYRWPRQTDAGFSEGSPLKDDGLSSHADSDGIVCLTALKGEPPAEQRLNAILADALGADWSAARLAGLLSDAGFAGRSLDDWLRDGFFAQHCELFRQRPFVWHLWDGRRDGFHALVNYHHLAAPNGEGRRTLEKLIYSYLGDWIDRQRADQKAGIDGADARLAHADHLRTELIKILDGEPPYDIFVRWKPLHQQPIGWDPDINDGVRVNIRPFMTARPLNSRGANACILRSVPKIKWEKDRGKEARHDSAEYPWLWSWDETTANFAGGAEFDGNRWNDLHYCRAVKQAARDRYLASVGGKI